MIYEIAGLRVLLQHKHPYTEKFCARYLSSDQETAADVVASATEEDIAEERAQSPNFSEGYIENICLYRSLCLQIPQRNRLLLHASVLDFNGKGYAFLGRSGTGKSTHTKLWLQNVQNTFVVNGDKPILQETGSHFIAYGTPWQGKEGWGARTETALCRLCFLEQAKGNCIKKLTPSETAARLFMQILIPSDEAAAVKTLELVDNLIRKTPAYLLSCNISEEAVKTSFEALTGLLYKDHQTVKEGEEKDED